jgi:hypothetical protein
MDLTNIIIYIFNPIVSFVLCSSITFKLSSKYSFIKKLLITLTCVIPVLLGLDIFIYVLYK